MAIRLEYAVQESVTNIRRNIFITLAAVLVVAVSLSLLGGVALIGRAIGRTASIWTGNVRVSIFLCSVDNKTCLSESEKDQLQQQLLAMPQVKSVHFETKTEAYANFKKLFANTPELLQSTSPDALPESFRVQLKDPSQFQIIRDEFEGRAGITIRDEKDTLQRLFAFSDVLREVSRVVGIVVLVAALLLIATTIRMALFARRKEIGIMKLVGATNWFIRIPFMVEGMVQGAIGGMLAIVLLLIAKPLVFAHLATANLGPTLRFWVTYGDIGIYAMYIMAAGILVGAIGSVLGLRRFLEV
ncbi:MAG: permease-like cell division protein FtsX [Actinomycetota bacterium]